MPTQSHLRAGMLRAVQEAHQWLGSTSPNPPVGAAALDEKGRIIAVAAHTKAGNDHAEMALLKLCQKKKILSQVHTMCVTLEPCNHQGRTPPCSEAIIEAGIRCVAIGVRDPNPRVQGGGADKLRTAGIEVVENVEREACQYLFHAFSFHARTGRPFITVKRAFNIDGSMIPPTGKKTFTSDASLLMAHRLRKKADAIITGSGTILTDHPLFTVRRTNDYPDKVRILAILDRRGRVPQDYLHAAMARRLEPAIYTDIDQCIADLERRGIIDILVESGPNLSESILDSGHWTMRIDILKNGDNRNDGVEVAYNQKEKIPFPIEGMDLDMILPH